VAEVVGKPVLGLRERKKQRTRAELIEAALALCNRQGFERTTVDQIAAVADVSPRTFSRYFATKDAVVLASIDYVVDVVAAELARQPDEIDHLQALYRAHVDAFLSTKTGAFTGLTADRLLAAARIINSSPALRLVASEVRMDAVNAALSRRMGVPADDQRLKLVSSLWGVILTTAMGEITKAEWNTVTVDDIVSRIESTYSLFLAETTGVGQPA
jgi:AcrR family transcriptional regulator